MADTDEEDKGGDVQTPRDPVAHAGDHQAVSQLERIRVEAPAEDGDLGGDQRPEAAAGPSDRSQRRLLEALLPPAQRCHVTPPSTISVHGHSVGARPGERTSRPTASPWPGM